MSKIKSFPSLIEKVNFNYIKLILVFLLLKTSPCFAKNNLKDYNGAISDFTKAIELNPDDADAYYNRGLAKSNLEDYYGAISDYNKAIELNPNDALSYNNRGVAKALLGNLSEACQDARKAKQLGYDASELIKMVCN